MDGSPVRVAMDVVHRRLGERLAELEPKVIGDVTRVFLELVAITTSEGLWSLQFAFDEDDGRIARLEARFGNGIVAERRGISLPGYEVRLLLPKALPKFVHDPTESVFLRPIRTGTHDLVVRFVRALNDLSAYRYVEALAAESVETDLL